MTGLSPSSVTFIVERLKRDKMISDQEVENHSRVSPAPSPYASKQMQRWRSA